MSDFLTVEDVNSVKLNNRGYTKFYEINTGLISVSEFSDIQYDFCYLSHSINGNNHTFVFEIHNSLWCGGYYLKDSNGDYLDINASYDSTTGKLTVITSETSISLILYLTDLAPIFTLNRLTLLPSTDLNLIFGGGDNSFIERILVDLTDNPSTGWQEIYYWDGNEYNYHIGVSFDSDRNLAWAYHDNSYLYKVIVFDSIFYYCTKFTSYDLDISILDSNLIIGQVNTVDLTLREYYPINHLDSFPYAIVSYDNIETLVDLNDREFDIDLRGKKDNKPVKVIIKSLDNEYYDNKTFEFTLPVHYNAINSYSDLKTNLGSLNTPSVIELSGDVVGTSDNPLVVVKDSVIYGNNHEIDLNSNSIKIKDGVSLKVLNTVITGGNPAFIQENNSKLVISDCEFTNCVIHEQYKASVITCEFNELELDYNTEIRNTRIINCPHTIYHGGNLITDNIKVLNNEITTIDTDYPCFLYQFEGTANITNSIFDIDYTTDYFCTNQLNMDYLQTLIMIGENAIINNVSYTNLKANNSLNFFGSVYNNQSHIYCKYYYPQIEKCVYISPNIGKESNCLCYALSGVDWIYKQNVQLTRVEWDNQNEIRKIS